MGYGKDTLYWYHTDLNGSPQEVTNEQGETVWSGQYGVFGQVRSQTDAMRHNFSQLLGRFHQPLRYAGQYLDEETGLHYTTYRYYAPEVGRFITPDPIGLAGGINLYQYAPNPVSWIDPWGLVGCKPTTRKPWKMTTQGTDKVVMHPKFGKIYKSKSDGLWWSKDTAGHGGSKWKVFKENKKGLEWYKDADEFGDFISGKHKGDIGKSIPWKDLKGTIF